MTDNELKSLLMIVGILVAAWVVFLVVFAILTNTLRSNIDMEFYRIYLTGGVGFLTALTTGIMGYYAGRSRRAS